MTVAEYIVRFLRTQGVSHVFETSGGMICPILDAVHRLVPSPKLVSCPNEQIAGFAAEGWARASGKPGVAMATSGPGATNLVTPIASCFYDSTPAIFITGQVPRRDLLEKRPGRRQSGFQETPVVDIVRPITKMVISAVMPRFIPDVLEQAWHEANAGRPGPVLVDIPFDVQREEIGDPPIAAISSSRTTVPYGNDVANAIALLQSAARPLILIGGGCRNHRDAVGRLVNRLWIPAVYSLMAKDVLVTDHPCNTGFIGSYGNRWANWALQNADVVLVIGSRLDVRQIGSDVNAFARGKKIIHVDIDPWELGARVTDAMEILSDVGAFCDAVIDAMPQASPVNGAKIRCSEWWGTIAERRAAWPASAEYPANTHDTPPWIMAHIADTDPRSYVVDVGQHQMWAAQMLRVERGQRFFTSGGHGAMGFSLPAAIGIALTGSPVTVIVGDGSLRVNAPALEMIARLDLPISIYVINNAGHGMVRQFQDEVFDGRHVSTEIAPIDFRDIGRAYGISSKRVWQISIDPAIGARPKLQHGSTLDHMSPEKAP